MRVALLIPGFFMGKGGAERVASLLATLIGNNGGSPTIFCSPSIRRKASYEVGGNVAIQQHDLYSGDALCGMANSFDVVVGFAMAGFFARIPTLARHLDAPLVIRECTNPSRMISILYIRRQDRCLSLRDAFWTRQAVFAHAAAIRVGVPAYAESVIPPLQPFTYAYYDSLALKEDTGTSTSQKKIVCVGAMKNANKNGLTAVKAFIQFARMNPDWELHLYGKNGFNDILANLQAESPWATIVDHGIENQIEKIYGDAAMLVIPSIEEGLPNVVAEAFAHGVPSIGFSDCPGVNHLIADGRTGFLVDRDDPAALTQAMGRLTDDELRKGFSHNAKTFAEHHFREEDFKRNWMTLLDNAARGVNRDGNPQLPIALDEANPLGQMLARHYSTGVGYENIWKTRALSG